MKNIIIYGSKEFGSVVRNLAVHCGYHFTGFIDDFDSDRPEILGTFESVQKRYDSRQYGLALAVGYSHLEKRNEIFEKIKDAGYSTPTLIHPAAYVDQTSRIQDGSFLMAGCSIDMEVMIGHSVVVWPGVVVSHNSIVGDNVFLSPNSTVCGHVRIGSNVFIGAGAVIVDHMTVDSNVFIKAGKLYYKS